MPVWNQYPAAYRHKEVQYIAAAVSAGECVAVVGLSGAGKSNLLNFIAEREDVFPVPNVLVDCNRLQENTVDLLLRLVRSALEDPSPAADEWLALDSLLKRRLESSRSSLCLLFDRFETLAESPNKAIFSSLRALRDAHKYQLTFVTATRRPLDPYSELAELFYAHTLWLGCLSQDDTRWNIVRYSRRVGQDWPESVQERIAALTWGYPSLLRAVCEAYADGAPLEGIALQDHPAVRRRLAEFWHDQPSQNDLQKAGLNGHPLLAPHTANMEVDLAQLTAKEILLWEYLRAHPEQVCAKDDLIRAVWPEDRIYDQGIRDDSLAQLVRRLRLKVEPDPSAPRFIHTVPGRGYLYRSNDPG
jgi:hypothetical protein